jgi:hypothetical protein
VPELAYLYSSFSLEILRPFRSRPISSNATQKGPFLKSQVSYPYAMTFLGFSLTLKGTLLSANSRTWPPFPPFLQEWPVTCQTPSDDSYQTPKLVRTVRNLYHTLRHCISLGHSLDIRKCESKINNVFITIVRLCSLHFWIQIALRQFCVASCSQPISSNAA